MKTVPDPNILAHLHLHAVLPTLKELLEHTPAVSEQISQKNFGIRLSVFNGPSQSLYFNHGRVCDTPLSPTITLYFLSCTQLNSLFTKRGIAIPLPMGNPLHFSKLSTFQHLTSLLETYLKPSPENLQDPAFLRIHTTLIFHLLMRALCIVGNMDSLIQPSVESLPSGTVFFQIRETGQTEAISIQNGVFNPIEPLKVSRPDVKISFDSAQTFYKVSQNDLDTLAAIGEGKIKIEGLIPLADGLNPIMDRILFYLEP